MSTEPASPPSDAYVECESVPDSFTDNTQSEEGLKNYSSSNTSVNANSENFVVPMASELGQLLLQHSEIGDWCAVVDNQISEEGEEDSESVSKKMSPVSRTPKPIHFFSPFYVFASDIKFSAKKHEIFYFFGGDLKVVHIHMYQNVGHPSMPQGFSGSCLIELKSLEALVDALKLDGNELLGRSINVECVHPETKAKKKFTSFELQGAQLGHSASNRGGYNRRDNRQGVYAGRLSAEGNVSKGSDYRRVPQSRISQNYGNQPLQPLRYSASSGRLPNNDVRTNQPQFLQISKPHYNKQAVHQQSQYLQQSRGSSQSNYSNQHRGGVSYQQDQYYHHEVHQQDTPQVLSQENAAPPKTKPDHEQIFGRSKPVDTANKFLEILKKVDQEERANLTLTQQQEHSQRTPRDHQNVSPREAGPSISRAQQSSHISQQNNQHLSHNENSKNASSQLQPQHYEGSRNAPRSVDFHRTYSRGHQQKLSDVSDHPPAHCIQKNYPQRQRYSNEQHQWNPNQPSAQYQRSRQESYSSRKNTDSGESLSQREYHNKNYSRNYDTEQSNKWQNQSDVAGSEVADDDYYEDFESAKSTNCSNDHVHQQITSSQNFYSSNKGTSNENYETESFINGGRRAPTGGNNRSVRQGNFGGGSQSARSGSESSTNIPSRKSARDYPSITGGQPLRKNYPQAARYNNQHHELSVTAENVQLHSNKQNQKSRPQLGIKGLTAIKRHIDQPSVDSKLCGESNNQQKVERTLSNTTTLIDGNTSNVTQDLTQPSLQKSISYDSQSRFNYSTNRRNISLKQQHSRNSVPCGENVAGVVRVFTNRNKDGSGATTGGLKSNADRLGDVNIRINTNKAASRQLRSDSIPTQLSNLAQQRKSSASSFSEKSNIKSHHELTDIVNNVNNATNETKKAVEGLKDALPSQQQVKSASIKNKKKASKKQENASVSTKNKYNVLLEADA